MLLYILLLPSTFSNQYQEFAYFPFRFLSYPLFLPSPLLLFLSSSPSVQLTFPWGEWGGRLLWGLSVYTHRSMLAATKGVMWVRSSSNVEESVSSFGFQCRLRAARTNRWPAILRSASVIEMSLCEQVIASYLISCGKVPSLEMVIWLASFSSSIITSYMYTKTTNKQTQRTTEWSQGNSFILIEQLLQLHCLNLATF